MTGADYVLPVEIEGTVHHVYVIVRPGCAEFLSRMGRVFEVVIFTASLSKYADPLLDLLDPENVIRARLFREACVYHQGNYVKDLSLIGRDTEQTIIVDNSPASFLFQPENAVLCDTFIDDPNDRCAPRQGQVSRARPTNNVSSSHPPPPPSPSRRELYALASFLEAAAECGDVREALHQWSTGAFRGLAGLTPRPEPARGSDDEESDDDAAAAAAAAAAARSPAARASVATSARRAGGRVSQSPSVLSSAPSAAYGSPRR